MFGNFNAAYKLSSGSLSLESMPFTRMPIISKMVRSIAAVTPTGEVLLNQLSVSITTLGLKYEYSRHDLLTYPCPKWFIYKCSLALVGS